MISNPNSMGVLRVIPLLLISVLMMGFESFKIVSWNVRGALHENGKLASRDIVRNRQPDVVILLETKCQFSRARHFWNSLGFYPICIQEARGFSGGLWVLLNNRTSVNFRVV